MLQVLRYSVCFNWLLQCYMGFISHHRQFEFSFNSMFGTTKTKTPNSASLVIHGADSSVTDALQWRHNELDCVSNHHSHDCLLNNLFSQRSKKISKLRATGLCEGIHWWSVNSPHKGPVTRDFFPFDDAIMKFPGQWASDLDSISKSWRHHDILGGVLFLTQAWVSLNWKSTQLDIFILW